MDSKDILSAISDDSSESNIKEFLTNNFCNFYILQCFKNACRLSDDPKAEADRVIDSWKNAIMDTINSSTNFLNEVGEDPIGNMFSTILEDKKEHYAQMQEYLNDMCFEFKNFVYPSNNENDDHEKN